MWSKNTTTRLCGRHQKQSVIIIQVITKITHAESSLGLGGSRRRAVRGRGIRAGRLRPGTSGRDWGGVRRGPRQLQASSVRHEQLEAIVSVDDRSERVRLDNRHSDVRVPTTAAIINQAQSEQNHSLTFRFRRYVVTATKPVHRLQMPQKCTTTGHTRHSASLHPGPCSSVRMRLGTDRQTYRQTDRHTDAKFSNAPWSVIANNLLCWTIQARICICTITRKHDTIHKTGSTQRIALSSGELSHGTGNMYRKFCEIWRCGFWDI